MTKEIWDFKQPTYSAIINRVCLWIGIRNYAFTCHVIKLVTQNNSMSVHHHTAC